MPNEPDARLERARGNRADYAFGTAEGWDAFRVARWHGVEQLSRPFHYEITLVRDATRGPADLQVLVDGAATLAIAHQHGVRPVHGVVGAAEELDRTRTMILYRVELVPHLVRARHRSTCRSFRKKSLKDAIARLLENTGGEGGGLIPRPAALHPSGVELTSYVTPTAGYRWSLLDSASARLSDPEYRSTVIQYNESDFDLLSRLLEEEGLTYHFEHTAEGSTMVLSDRLGAAPAYGAPMHVVQRANDGGADSWREHVHAFRQRFDLRPRAARVVDQDRMVPRLRLEGRTDGAAVQSTGAHASFACPGGSAYCDLFSRLAMERHDAQRALATGTGAVRALEPGVRAIIRDGEGLRDDRDVLFERVEAYAQEFLPEGTSLDREPFGFDDRPHRVPFYENRFRALHADVPYRPELTVPKPRMGGIHRAIVTNEEGGAANPEINANANGDVRVRFAWDDRLPEAGVASSQWIPVVNAWGGTGWGAHHTPRVGQTVMVAFHDGDVDQPVVLGGYYSAQTPPPYDASKTPTVSGMRSQSSPGGGGSNEISFDDSAGNEMLSTNAQKDASHSVGNDASHSVGNDYDQDIGGDEQRSVNGDKTASVGGAKSTSVGGPHAETNGQDKSVTVAGTYRVDAEEIDLFGTAEVHAQGKMVSAFGDTISLMTSGGASFILKGSSAFLGADTVTVSGLVVKVGGGVVLVDGGVTIRLQVGGSTVSMSAAEIVEVASLIHLNPG
ncbi:MAG TPA: type VI secretion system tip protein TssI/VgrG [Byssovorax sp.]